jgi:hypothetical protein
MILQPMDVTGIGRQRTAALLWAARLGIPPVTRADQLCLILWKGGGMARGASCYWLVDPGLSGLPRGTPLIEDRRGNWRIWQPGDGWINCPSVRLDIRPAGRPA